MRDSPQWILFHGVPDVEKKNAAGFEDAMRFARAQCFVGKKHDAELADDCVEGAIVEWQAARVRLFPFVCVVLVKLRGGGSHHRLVQIRRDQTHRCRQPVAQDPRKNPGAAGELENGAASVNREPCGEVLPVRLEKNRTEITVVCGRDRSGKLRVFIFHIRQRFSNGFK